MPAYNAELFIGQAIESVLAQTYSSWELLVVDDGSTDDTAVITAQFTDLRIKLIRKENGGESSARNVALDNSRGAFIAYLDADDVWLCHHLETLIGYLQAHPDMDAVYTDGWHINRDGKRLKPLSSRRRGPFEGRIFEEVVRASDVFGPPVCVVLRRDLVERHHLRYDTHIVIGPDWDFFMRFADVGRFGYVDALTCEYRIHTTNITFQVDWERRVEYIALCREKSIKMPGFRGCSTETRMAVFYDLLVVLLAGKPERQMALMRQPEFAVLPAAERGLLLRLAAVENILTGTDDLYVMDWLQQARLDNPDDRIAVWLAKMYLLSPGLTRQILWLKRRGRTRSRPLNLFDDLE